MYSFTSLIRYVSTTLQYLLPIVYIPTFDRTLAYAILNRANYTDFETKNKTESKIVVTALSPSILFLYRKSTLSLQYTAIAKSVEFELYMYL